METEIGDEGLKACPFDGGEAVFIKIETESGMGIRVKCKFCNTKGVHFSEWDWENGTGIFNMERSKERAARFWNGRVAKKGGGMYE